ncbi:MAG: FkbM family methyltransferase [Magnetococcales bacterium]|nr:FkbM family methyltransferase [Magnetococcales bacterium]
MQTSMLFQILAPQHSTIIVDAGANPVDPTAHYRPLLETGRARLIGFEPQEEALALLEQTKGPCETYLPWVLGDGKEHSLQMCSASVMTSLLEPNPVACQAFHLFHEFTQVKNRLPVPTRTLDQLDEIPPIDHLKMNVCGSELMILSHGPQKLANVAVIQLEVAFIPLYLNQPTQGELDIMLRKMGMVPHSFSNIKRWCIKPLMVNGDPRIPLNQLLVAEMVYVADFLHPQRLSDERLKQMAIILHYGYHSYDLVLYCLEELARRGTIHQEPGNWYLDFAMSSRS